MAPGYDFRPMTADDLPMIRRNRETKRLEKVRDPDPGECLAAVEDYLASFEATGTRIAREPGAKLPDVSHVHLVRAFSNSDNASMASP